MAKTILLIGAFDTKGPDYAFVRKIILSRGHNVLTVNTGVLGSTKLFPVDVEAGEKARGVKDRGEAMKIMSAHVPEVVRKLKFDGIFGMGGGGGSAVITAAMRALPLGVPKICVSTLASGDTSPYVGLKDVTLIPSIVDVAGINRISRKIYTRAAGAICGMVESEPEASREDKPMIAASMFGNTTECVNACVEALGAKGYEIVVFHATGTGGRTMESLVSEKLIDAVLDITTTEWADEICGGVLSAGPERLDAPGKAGIPHLIVPGCVDMANFGPRATVPEKYSDRKLYEWNPAVTLMRTNVDENRAIGKKFAEKANAAKGPVAFLIPKKGVSILDADGGRFCDREADEACFDAIRTNVKREVPVVELNNNINDTEFAAKAVAMLLEMMK